MKKLIVMGTGQIGQAVKKLSKQLLCDLEVETWGIENNPDLIIDLTTEPSQITQYLILRNADFVFDFPHTGWQEVLLLFKIFLILLSMSDKK